MFDVIHNKPTSEKQKLACIIVYRIQNIAVYSMVMIALAMFF